MRDNTPARRTRPCCLTLLGVALAALLALPRPAAPALAQAEATVRYPAGWNLVAALTGATLTNSHGPLFLRGPGDDDYRPGDAGDLVGGRGGWVYFAAETTLTLGHSAAEYSRLIAAPGTLAIVGNPSATEAVRIVGARAAFAYTPGDDYRAVRELQPGQAALVTVGAGGEVTLGVPPQGAAAAEVRRLQLTLYSAPAERGSIDALGVVTADLVKNRQYGQAQAASDDLRAAAEDGLRLAGSGPLPSLPETQRQGLAAVREAVARAKAAAAAGQLQQADAALEAARRAAQAVQDDGVSLAKEQAGANAVTPLLYAGARQAGQNLAGFGALLRAGIASASLGQAPNDAFWTLAGQVLALPPQPVATPAPAPAVGPPPAPPPPPPSACPNGCTFTGEGAQTQEFPPLGVSRRVFSVQFSVTDDRVSGSGQLTETPPPPPPGMTDPECFVFPTITHQAQLAVSGELVGSTLSLTIAIKPETITPPTEVYSTSCDALLPPAQRTSSRAPSPVYPGSIFFDIANPVGRGFFDLLEVEAHDGATGTAHIGGRASDCGCEETTIALHGGPTGAAPAAWQ